MLRYSVFDLQRNSDNLFLLCTGESINNLSDKAWETIASSDSLAMNNFFYHPTFVPNMLSMELKSYDFDIAKRRLCEKWEMGWKNVSYILPLHRANYLEKALGKDAKTYVWRGEKRGSSSSSVMDAKFPLNTNYLWKSYNASVTAMFHLSYLLGYKNVIVCGMTGRNSRYFWTDMPEHVRGEVHAIFNKDHEHSDPLKPHHASHIKPYVVDFNFRHMKPNNRSIYVADCADMLYPEISLWRF